MHTPLTPIFALLLSALVLANQSLAAESAEAPVLVTVAPLSSLLFRPRHSAPATVEALNQSDIVAQTSGELRELPIRVGDKVEQGGTLARLDCRDNELLLRQRQAQFDSAQARLALAQKQMRRIRSLAGDRNVSEELLNQSEFELADARAGLALAQATREGAELAVARCTIEAPFAGIVLARLANVGEYLSPGQPLARLLDHQELEIKAMLPADLAEPAATAQAPMLELGGEQFPLLFARLVAAIDPMGRSREARYTFADAAALPGASGRLTWRTEHPHLPADLVVERDGRLGIFLAKGETARFHPLPQAIEGRPAPVEALDEASLVIQAGREALADGAPLAIAR